MPTPSNLIPCFFGQTFASIPIQVFLYYIFIMCVYGCLLNFSRHQSIHLPARTHNMCTTWVT